MTATISAAPLLRPGRKRLNPQDQLNIIQAALQNNWKVVGFDLVDANFDRFGKAVEKAISDELASVFNENGQDEFLRIYNLRYSGCYLDGIHLSANGALLSIPANGDILTNDGERATAAVQKIVDTLGDRLTAQTR